MGVPNKNRIVSVVISCYNLGEYLDDALLSLRNQTYSPVEVIVLDDDSTDVMTIRTFKRLENKYPEFEFIHLSHRGVEEIRNCGIQRSKGTYVCAMDADDIFHPDYLKRCVAYLNKNKDKSVVTTYVKLFGKEKGTWKTQDYDPTILFTQNVLHISSVFKRTVFDAVGGYDKQFKEYSDWEFWLHSQIKGFKWGMIPEELFLYRIRRKSMLGDAKKMDSELYRRMIQKHRNYYKDNEAKILIKYRNELLHTIRYGNDNIAMYQKKLIASKKQLIDSEDKITTLSASCKILTELNMKLKKTNEDTRKTNEELRKRNKELRKTNEDVRKTNEELSGIIHDNEGRLNQYERERDQLIKIVESIGRSRYMRIRTMILGARTIPQILLLPLHILYLLLPDKLKSVWRKIKKTVGVRLYRESPWDAKKPIVSVVIPVFNYGAYVKEAIKSVQEQTFTDYEIILIDGGSTDGTSRDVLRKIRGRNIRKYFRKERHFAGDNRNFGINKARGKYIVCLDPDDLIEPTYLEKAVFIAETMKYDIVGCGLRAFGKSDFVAIHPLKISLSDEVQENRLASVALFRKEFWEKVGGYKDWRKGRWLIHEDWEFWVRMMGHGARVFNIQEPLMHWRHHGSNNSKDKNVPDIDFQRKFIIKANEELISEMTERASERANNLVYQNIDPLKNLNKSNNNKMQSIFFGIPYFDCGGADKLYQEIEKAMSWDFKVSVVTTQELLPERTDVIEGHRKITGSIYNLPALFPGSLGSSAQKYLFSSFFKYLLNQHKPSYLYQGGSEFIYEILPKIKKWSKDIIVVDNQFNIGNTLKA